MTKLRDIVKLAPLATAIASCGDSMPVITSVPEDIAKCYVVESYFIPTTGNIKEIDLTDRKYKYEISSHRYRTDEGDKTTFEGLFAYKIGYYFGKRCSYACGRFNEDRDNLRDTRHGRVTFRKTKECSE